MRTDASRHNRRSYGSPLCLLKSIGFAGYIKKDISGCQILEHAWLPSRKAQQHQNPHRCREEELSSQAPPGKLSRCVNCMLHVLSGRMKTRNSDTADNCDNLLRRTFANTVSPDSYNYTEDQDNFQTLTSLFAVI